MSNTIDEVSNAIELATRAHYGQLDKQGEPYIFHCLRVMMKFSDKDDRIIAVLHDTIEDSDLELSDIDDFGFSDYVVNIIDCLTKRPDELYFDYLDRVKSNETALRIKLADMDDNVSRLDGLYRINRQTARALERKYSEAKRYLTKDNP